MNVVFDHFLARQQQFAGTRSSQLLVGIDDVEQFAVQFERIDGVVEQFLNAVHRQSDLFAFFVRFRQSRYIGVQRVEQMVGIDEIKRFVLDVFREMCPEKHYKVIVVV